MLNLPEKSGNHGGLPPGRLAEPQDDDLYRDEDQIYQEDDRLWGEEDGCHLLCQSQGRAADGRCL